MGSRAAVVLALVATGCAAPSRYLWAGYQESVYALTAGEGADLGGQIAQLQETVERSRGEGRLVAPGMHAHLGYLYALNGEPDLAVAAFESERELYPESTVLIDRLLERMRGEAP